MNMSKKTLSFFLLVMLFLSSFNVNFISSELSITVDNDVESSITVDNDAKMTIDGKLSLTPDSFIKEDMYYNLKDGITTYKNDDLSYRMYEKEKNIYEYETILYITPKENIFSYKLTGDYTYIKQLPLDKYDYKYDFPIIVNATHIINEKTKRVIDYRPIDIVNSYSVYDRDEKLYQIYSPYIVDSNNVKTYCDMDIKDNVLSITIPQIVIDKGKYPLILDPTIGKTNLGSSYSTLSYGYYDSDNSEWVVDDYIRGYNVSIPDNSEITKIRIGVKNNGDNDVYIKGAIYDTTLVEDSTANLQAQTNQTYIVIGTSTPTWVNCTFSENPIIESEDDYMITAYGSGDVSNIDNSFDLYVCYDSNTPQTVISSSMVTLYDKRSNSGDGTYYPSTIKVTNHGYAGANRRFSIYLEYEEYVSTVWITVTSTYTGSGYVKVDNVSKTTPYVFEANITDKVLLEAISPVSINSYEQKVYTSWSDSGSQTHNYTVPSSNATVTANYKTQIKHSLVSNPISGETILKYNGVDIETPYTSGWVDTGTEIEIYAYVNPVDYNSYAFSEWNSDDRIGRNSTYTPSTHQVYNATYTPITFDNTLINIFGNATIDVNGTVISVPHSFNATIGSEYNITAYDVPSLGVTLNVTGSANIELDGVPVVTPDSYLLSDGSTYVLDANDIPSLGVILDVTGNANINLDGVPVVTPDSFLLTDGDTYLINALNTGGGSGGFGTQAMFFFGMIALVLFLITRGINKR